jgi:hypothetical protein
LTSRRSLKSLPVRRSASVRRSLRDPDSAIWRGIAVVCGEDKVSWAEDS